MVAENNYIDIAREVSTDSYDEPMLVEGSDVDTGESRGSVAAERCWDLLAVCTPP